MLALLNDAAMLAMLQEAGLKLSGQAYEDEFTDEELAERSAVENFPEGFRVFLPHWKFRNRETGQTMSFADLWPGQELAVQFMLDNLWVFLLKAGKLGFTELECAWDAYVALHRQENALVNLFSKDQESSWKLLEIVKFGIVRLPKHLSRRIMSELPGGRCLNRSHSVENSRISA